MPKTFFDVSGERSFWLKDSFGKMIFVESARLRYEQSCRHPLHEGESHRVEWVKQKGKKPKAIRKTLSNPDDEGPWDQLSPLRRAEFVAQHKHAWREEFATMAKIEMHS